MTRVANAVIFAAAWLATLGATPKSSRPVDVAIVTSSGTIVVRLEPAKAPRTTQNFLHYVRNGAYDGTSFYRNVTHRNEPQAPFEVIQGGRGASANGATLPPVTLEPTNVTGLHNTDGTIAMARTADPDSATTEFFLDVGDARYLDAGGPLGPGYAAFGHVVRGTSVVRKIHAAATQGEALTPEIRILRMRVL